MINERDINNKDLKVDAEFINDDILAAMIKNIEQL